MVILVCTLTNKACLKIRGQSKPRVSHRGLELYRDRQEVICLDGERAIRWEERGAHSSFGWEIGEVRCDCGLLLCLSDLSTFILISGSEILLLKPLKTPTIIDTQI